jgi:uncharacterized protein YgbK (DUF1537 family)
MLDSLCIGCIADDFTGGSDAASFLRKAGLRTILLNGNRDWEKLEALRPQAVVIALKSRSVSPELTVSQSLEAANGLLKCGAAHLYFKYCPTFDSTLQGNIGPVTNALLGLTESRYTLLCPSLPINGRTVKDGVLYVHGVPLAESSLRNHPITPMTESDISVLMGKQSRCPCFVLSKDKLGDAAVLNRCSGSDRFTVVPFYVSDEDRARIAKTSAI